LRRKVLISEEFLRMLAEGKVKYVEEEKIKLGRWILKEKIGDFIGCKGEVEDKK